MLIYNTTYTMPTEDARNFVIWIQQSYLTQVAKDGTLANPHLMRILSHHDQESECFSLQFSTESSATLHQWYTRQGKTLADEMEKLFDGRVVGFSTLMEEVL